MKPVKEKRTRPGPERSSTRPLMLLAGVMSSSLLIAGCRGVGRALLARLDGSAGVAIGPIQAGVAELAADQPIVRRRTVLEVPPEQGAPPRLALLPPGRRLAVVEAALRQAAPLGPVAPAASGPGVVVAEPVVRQADGATGQFGAGCGRWLQFVVAGHGELGKTPLWTDLDRARHELGRHDLRLNRVEAMKLGRMLGVTHVAIGEIQGSPPRCTLTYRLLKLPEGHAVATPLVSSGTAAQIEAGLPQLARAMVTRLGVASPRVPPRVDASSEELRALGRLPLLPGSAISPALYGRLEQTAVRLPLAGLLLLESDWMHDEARLHQTVERLRRQVPDHPLILGEIAGLADMEMIWHPHELERALRRFPNHHLLVQAALFRQRLLGGPPQERRLARHLICCAPGNPRDWLLLGATLETEADRIRRGRTYRKLSPVQREVLRPVYHQWLTVVAQSVRRDPLYGRAWLRVAVAACFAGDRKLAEAAFWRAVKLAPDDLDVYDWGLQMYQPKWLNDRSQLLQVARRAVAVRHPYAWQCQYLVAMLRDSHLNEAAERVAAAFVAENRLTLTRQPALAQAHYNLAVFLKPDSPMEARQEFRAVVRQRPEDAEAHYDLGLLLDDQHRTEAALREYQETLRLNPRHQWVHYDIGYALKEKGDLAGAQREFQAALRLRPGYPEAHFGLGEVYSIQHRLDAAAAEYRQAAQRPSPFPEAFQRLCSALAERGRYPEAITAGREAVRLDPNSGDAHDALAYAYGMSHQAAACAREARAAIRINPVDALAHEDLGDALVELGRRAEARAEWQRVLQLETMGPNAQEAREMLAKYP